ncbi:hypothetical protein V6B16_10750 [Salinimicrobium catena]|uniref:hypothetical protein n=1 Tax=Salinimicrobium catena TaxID=390640 RepID=UPI002FE4E030
MPNLIFNRLLVLSNSSKQANQFVFKKTLNLITAVDNSVGKSTLVKLLFWGLGCEPYLDSNWNSTDSKTIVEFEIDGEKYSVLRYNNQIKLKGGKLEKKEYDKITGDYSEDLAQILNFKALLPNRSEDYMDIPPPAFYFLPFYIDQKRSWSTAWNNFDKLQQYSNWKSTIIKYHVGLLPERHFELEKVKSEKKESKKAFENQIDKIETTLEVVQEYIPKISVATTNSERFQKITSEIKVDLNKLQLNQENLLNALTNLNSEKVYLENQKNISEKIILDLDKDYKFTIENLEEDEIECPLCGVVHENSIINRASIMTDKSQAENQLNTINEELERVNKKLVSKQKALDKARSEIEEINSKYILEWDEINEDGEKEKTNISQIIENIAGNSIKQTVLEDKSSKLSSVAELKSDIKNIKEEQKNILTKKQKEEIISTFNNLFHAFIEKMDAEGINTSSINSPLDYNKIVNEGGAAEGTRAILAYYLSIYKMVEKFSTEVISALVVDTPNQHEQSESNYEKIVDILISDNLENNQIFLCAMENEHLQPFKESANVITLSNDKILSKSGFGEIKKYFEAF